MNTMKTYWVIGLHTPILGVCVGWQRPRPTRQCHHHGQPQASFGAGIGRIQDHTCGLWLLPLCCLGNHRPVHSCLPWTCAFLCCQGSFGSHSAGYESWGVLRREGRLEEEGGGRGEWREFLFVCVWACMRQSVYKHVSCVCCGVGVCVQGRVYVCVCVWWVCVCLDVRLCMWLCVCIFIVCIFHFVFSHCVLLHVPN